MSNESLPIAVPTQEKVVSLTPFSALTDEELGLHNLSPDVVLRLERIPGLDIEHNELLRPETGNVLDDVFTKPFSYARYVDKKGELHYWCIDLEPQLVGQTGQVIEELVGYEPNDEAKSRMISLLKKNLPRLTITPDKGAVMSFVDGITINIGNDRNYRHWIDGSDIDLKKKDDEFDDCHYETEALQVNIESYVFDDNRKDDLLFQVQGDVKYLSLGMKEIVKKLNDQLQPGLITESMVRCLVNPSLNVWIENVEGEDRELLAS